MPSPVWADAFSSTASRCGPGGPTLLAKLPDGRFVVGLPGNPLAAMMGVFTVLHPLLAGLQGIEARGSVMFDSGTTSGTDAAGCA